jgi:Ser/Thr protein kinase RdoA (MazF antagonist)
MDTTVAMASWGCLKGATATQVDAFSGTVTRFVSPHGQFYLKRKPSIPLVAREVRVLHTLAGAHLPVTLPLLTHAQRPYVADGSGVFCLYAALPGTHYHDCAAPQGLTQAAALGAAIGQLHLAFAQCEHIEGFATFGDPSRGMVAALRAERPGVCDIEHLDTLVATLRSPEALPQTLIHRDPHPGNLLFEDGQLSGVLDFDLMMRGPRLFDPCYCATSMLMARFADEAYRPYWFDILWALFTGYRRMVPLTAAEQSGMFTMLAMIQLIFISYALHTHRPDTARMNQSALFWLNDNRQPLEEAIAVSQE